MKKGFTLVELLVVVAILGILAAVGIVSFVGFVLEGDKTSVFIPPPRQQLKTIRFTELLLGI